MSDEKTIIADAGTLSILNPPKRKKACLVQYSGAKLGKRYILDESVMTAGRVPPANIIINEATVSRKHARFIQTNQLVEIEDLGSANGTYVNDKQAEGRIPLRDGDIIRLGTILLKFFAYDNLDNVIQDKIYRMATIDPGTQIFNRQYLMDALESEVKFSRTYSKPLSIIYYDLDFFKKVNDTYGHNAGDFVLKTIAELVRNTIRKDDILGRFGGEEFIIILPNTDGKLAYELADRVRQAVEKHPLVFELQAKDGKSKKFNHKQTVSCGVAQFKPEMASVEVFLDAADKKLYVSKESGRNRVTI